jgi:hypothetical protein
MLAGVLPLMAVTPSGAVTTVRLEVPKQVADHAAARITGNAAAPAPILVLEDLELGAGEGIEILVLGPVERQPGSPATRPLLGTAGMVGRPQARPAAPLEHVTLPIALNDRASRLLAGKRAVTLTLQVDGSPGRPPLRFKRAYFDPGGAVRASATAPPGHRNGR